MVIGETCKIGKRVKLYHGVTLGARSFANEATGHIVKGVKRHPNVEGNEMIYPNSVIFGGEMVLGANSTVCANVFLMQSVPADSQWSMTRNSSSSARKDQAAQNWID